MLWGKRKKTDTAPTATKTDEQSALSAVVGQADIHIMPERFYVAPPKSYAGIIVLIIALLGVGGIGFGAWYWITHQPVVPPPVQQPTVTLPTTPIVEQPVAQPTPPAVVAPVTTSTPVDMATTTPAIPTSTPPIDTQPPTPVALFRAADSDSDMLSAAEESMYGTNANLADTDGDGYLDGAELLGGYDPLQAQKSLSLETAFNQYTRPGAPKFIYPLRWSATVAESNTISVVSPTGEGISIKTVPRDPLALKDVVVKAYPQYATTPFSDYTARQQFSGVRSNDGYVFALVHPQQASVVYVITYIPGADGQVNFATTMNLLVQSLSF